VRKIADYVVKNWRVADMYNVRPYNTNDRSIWEVRSKKQVLHPIYQSSKSDLTNLGQNFTYSKIQLWVALDRALRLADKRNLPCPNRMEWLQCRDTIYEEIMDKAFNVEKQVISILDYIDKDLYSII
jgi:GH15 family glucan-1,4-alpha-glucosidase